jgi:hypothetical protein
MNEKPSKNGKDLLTGVSRIKILNYAEKKHFIKDDIKIR